MAGGLGQPLCCGRVDGRAGVICSPLPMGASSPSLPLSSRCPTQELAELPCFATKSSANHLHLIQDSRGNSGISRARRGPAHKYRALSVPRACQQLLRPCNTFPDLQLRSHLSFEAALDYWNRMAADALLTLCWTHCPVLLPSKTPLHAPLSLEKKPVATVTGCELFFLAFFTGQVRLFLVAHSSSTSQNSLLSELQFGS